MDGAEWFVSPLGFEADDCGRTEDEACVYLNTTLLLAGAGDTILVDWRAARLRPDWLCGGSTLRLDRPLTLAGHGGRAHIGCPVGGERRLALRIAVPRASWSEHPAGERVVFRSLDFTSAEFVIEDAQLTFARCSLVDCRLRSTSTSWLVDLAIERSVWRGVTVDPTADVLHFPGASHVDLHSSMVRCRIWQTTFYNSRVTLTASLFLHVSVHRSLFTSDGRTPTVLGGLRAVLVEGSEPSDVTVTDSAFERQRSDDPLRSVFNMYDAALSVTLRVSGPRVRVVVHIAHVRLFVRIARVRFTDNERGLTLTGPLAGVVVDGCRFADNAAVHAGAAVYLRTDITTDTTLVNCTFTRNAAGSLHALRTGNATAVTVRGDNVVVVRAPCCRGSVALVGKGGAVRSELGRTRVERCTFTDNTARLQGGAYLVDRQSEAVIVDSVFTCALEQAHAREGDLIYSNGQLVLRRVRLTARAASCHATVLFHAGAHWSVAVHEVTVECPAGHRVQLYNSSMYVMRDDGLMQFYTLDHLAYFCESCPPRQYSLDSGYLHHRHVYTSDYYFTMLVNGRQPSPAYSNGTFVRRPITCLACPYGGRCRDNVTAVPNFWGYRHAAELRFQRCPRGYCCMSPACRRHDECAPHRAGRLCGRCVAGYSEALFSPRCVPHAECDDTWLWPLVIGSGLLYVLFLLYEKDFRDMLFVQTTLLRNVLRRVKPVAGPPSPADTAPSRTPQQQTAAEPEGIDTQPPPDDGPPTATPDFPTDAGAGFMIILFYYFQDAQLLHLDTVFGAQLGKEKALIMAFLSGLLKLRINLFQFLDKECFVARLSPSLKLIVQVMLIPYVLLHFAILYFLYRCCVHRRRPANASDGRVRNVFLCRLASGFTLSLLFTYQKLATTTFALLNCVPIGDVSVLFIDGTITCYAVWQYAVFCYVACSLVPFCFVLLLGPGLITDRLISLRSFFVACFVPLPFLVHWVALRLQRRAWPPPDATEPQRPLAAESQSVVHILQGPFRDAVAVTTAAGGRRSWPTCGAGVHIGRRLVLIALSTFVNNTLFRTICMLLFCFVILLHHMHVLPYKEARVNAAASVSASALLVVGGINLLRAGFEAAEYVPLGPNRIVVQVLDEVEAVLMFWLPVSVVGVAVAGLAVNLALMAMHAVLPSSRPTNAPTKAARAAQVTVT